MEEEKKEKRKRSIGKRFYPIHSLEESIKIAKALKTLGGSVDSNEKDLIASAMKLKLTGAFTNRLGSARNWRLLTGHGKLELTDLAKRLISPISDEEYREGILEAFFGVPLFKSLYETYENMEIPEDDLLQNILERKYNVPAGDTVAVVKIFKKMIQLPEIVGYSAKPSTAVSEKETTELSNTELSKKESRKIVDSNLSDLRPEFSVHILNAFKDIGKLEFIAEIGTKDRDEEVKSILSSISQVSDLPSSKMAAKEILNNIGRGMSIAQAASFHTLLYNLMLRDLNITKDENNDNLEDAD